MVELTAQQQAAIDAAHDAGRHVSTARADRQFWRNAGCTECGARYDANGLPRLQEVTV